LDQREESGWTKVKNLASPAMTRAEDVEVGKVGTMDAYEALQTIQRLARIALASEQGQSAEVLADIQRRALNGIALVTQKALAKAP
jgi:hypothetical protein